MQCNHNFEILGFLAAAGSLGCRNARGSRTALLPISVTIPLNFFFGIASIETSAGCPSFTLTMSVSSTFTSAVMMLISATVIRVEPGEFWMPTTTVSPSRTGRLVTTPSKGAR